MNTFVTHSASKAKSTIPGDRVVDVAKPR